MTTHFFQVSNPSASTLLSGSSRGGVSDLEKIAMKIQILCKKGIEYGVLSVLSYSKKDRLNNALLESLTDKKIIKNVEQFLILYGQKNG